MATDIIYADTSDAQIESSNATYATARAGSNLSAQSGTTVTVGQYNDGFGLYFIYEAFVQFNTSGIGTDMISAAVLSLYGNYDGSTNDFDVQARVRDWGATLTTADWVAGASLSALTLVAHKTTSGGWPTNAYTDFANDALPANIIGSGQTLLLLDGSRHVAGNVPGSGVNEYVVNYSADYTGTTRDPKLTITHAPGGSNVLVQPAAAAATVGTSTAAIVAQNWPKAQPAAGAVTIGTATPAIALPIGVAPAAAAVGVAAATPAVVAQNWPKAQPAAAAVTVATATPAIVAQDYILVQPAAAQVAIAGATGAVLAVQTYVPAAATVAVGMATPALSAVQTYSPAAAVVSVGTDMPTLTLVITPTAGAMNLTGVTSDVGLPVLAEPAAAALVFAGATPSVQKTDNIILTPGVVTLNLVGLAPSVSESDNRLILPVAATMVLIGATPSVIVGVSTIFAEGIPIRLLPILWSQEDDEDVILSALG